MSGSTESASSPSARRVSPGEASVDLLDLATSALASAIAASLPIRKLAELDEEEFASRPTEAKEDVTSTQDQATSPSPLTNGYGLDRKDNSQKNIRTKLDGTIVTAADGAAQRIISSTIRHVSSDIRIVGEESRKEMEKSLAKEFEEATRRFLELDLRGHGHRENEGQKKAGEGASDGHVMEHEIEGIFNMVREETSRRYADALTRNIALPTIERTKEREEGVPDTLDTFPALPQEQRLPDMLAPSERVVDASRVSVFIDPLDGTSCYATGKHECVTTLVAVVLDNTPIFGVICKPFGHEGEPCILNSGCYAVYGGLLLGGAYVAGGNEIEHSRLHRRNEPVATRRNKARRAVISKSRSGGVVGKCIQALSREDLLQPEPVHVSGAGVKALRLLVGTEDEALWFFPKSGTSLWDVAAADALLRAVGGRLSDKNGDAIDYSKSRQDAENELGIVASNDAFLHSSCILIFQSAHWRDED